MKLVITERAAQAIVEQYDYYGAAESEALALRWEECVTATIQSLLRNPLRGSRGRFLSEEFKEIRKIAVRRFPRHAVYYICDDSPNLIRIVHVLHSARDTERHLPGSRL